MKALYKFLILSLCLCFNVVSFSANTDNTTKIFISVPNEKSTQQTQAIQLIKTYFEALNDRNMSLFFSTLHPNVTHDINQGKTEKGIENFKKFMMKAVDSSRETFDNIVIMVSDDGRYASALWVDHGTYVKNYPGEKMQAKNQHYTLPGGHFFEIQNGKISHVTTYYNAADFSKQMDKQK
jgi:steroid delta-isomerase-like uncharacterized protein